MRRRLRFVVPACAAALGVLAALAGCGRGTEPEQVPAEFRGINLKAELDPATGAVTLPYDRLSLTREEESILSVASSTVLSQCGLEHGVRFTPPTPRYDPVYASEQYFGPWTKDQARQFGFVAPQTEADLYFNGIEGVEAPVGPHSPVPNQNLTDADWKTLSEKCEGLAESSAYSQAEIQVGPWIEALDRVNDELDHDKRARGLIDELSDCYARSGLEPGGKIWWLPQGGRNRSVTEDQISLALAVVDCKDSIDFTNRMAQIQAQLQAPIIIKYADDLIARRQFIDKTVASARELIAKNKVP